MLSTSDAVGVLAVVIVCAVADAVQRFSIERCQRHRLRLLGGSPVAVFVGTVGSSYPQADDGYCRVSADGGGLTGGGVRRAGSGGHVESIHAGAELAHKRLLELMVVMMLLTGQLMLLQVLMACGGGATGRRTAATVTRIVDAVRYPIAKRCLIVVVSSLE